MRGVRLHALSMVTWTMKPELSDNLPPCHLKDVFVTFLIDVTKSLTKVAHGRRAYLAHSLGATVHHSWEVVMQDPVRKQRETNAGTWLVFSFLFLLEPRNALATPTVSLDLTTSINSV